MSWYAKAVLFLFAGITGYFLVIHGSRALHASLPSDMPGNANFIQTGFDIEHNEAKGQWVACRQDAAQSSDFCRVTDAQGVVMYQGSFIPLDTPEPLPNRQLRVAGRASHLWVTGPSERGPIPVIPLSNGKLLVPEQDRDALVDRWRADPSDLSQLAGS